MSEEKIIDIIKDFLELREIHSNNNARKSFLSIYQEAIQGLLDLYNKEKQENLTLLTRLKADSLLARDNYWKKKITNKVEEIGGMSEIADIEREIYNRNEYAIEMLLELLEE